MGINMSEEEYQQYITKRTKQGQIKRVDTKTINISSDNKKRVTKANKSKYGNKKVYIDGMKFDSRKEYRRWQQLKILEQAGIITKIERQVPFELMEGYYLDGKKVQNIEYVCDFRVTYADGHVEIEDVKSEATKKDKVYVLKRKLFHYKYRYLRIKEV